MRKNQGITLGIGTSYVSSTSIDRPSDGKLEDINGGVHVPIVENATFWANPFAHGERKDWHRFAARRAHLRRWLEATAPQKFGAVPFALVFKHRYEVAPTTICDSARELMVSYKPRGVYILHRNDLVLVNYAPGELMVEIVSLCCYMLLDSSDLAALSPITLRPLALASEPTLFAGEFYARLLEMPRVRDLLASGERAEVLDADVDSNAALGLRVLRRGLYAVVNREADVVGSRRILADGHFLDGPVHFPMRLELDDSDLGKAHAIAVDFHSAECSRLAGRPLGLKSRIGGGPIKKSLECGSAIRDCLFKHPIRDFRKPDVFLFYASHELVQVVRRQRFTSLGIMVISLFKSPIIRPPCAVEGALERRFLGARGVQAVFVGYEHSHMLPHIRLMSIQKEGAVVSTPWLKSGVSTAA